MYVMVVSTSFFLRVTVRDLVLLRVRAFDHFYVVTKKEIPRHSLVTTNLHAFLVLLIFIVYSFGSERVELPVVLLVAFWLCF